MDQPDVVLSLRALSKHFGTVVAVDAIDLEIRRGEFVTLLGPSGCGKTTTVRMIGGYEVPTSGTITLDGEDITFMPARKRNIGMVFQDYALFPHMSVRDNVAFPLRMRGWERARIDQQVGEMLGLVRLEGMGRRHPQELSGGQRQRVALARALAFSPRLLLMDEALGALDAKLREYMRIEIRRIQQLLGITTIHVTHDQDEALGMSDRVVVMRQARIAQVASPRTLYADPTSVYVADFVGRINLLPGIVVEHRPEATIVRLDPATQAAGADPGPFVAQPGADVPVRRSPERAPGTVVQVGIRPEAIRIGPADGGGSLHGRVSGSRFGGAIVYITVVVGGGRQVEVLLRPGEPIPTADVTLSWRPEDAVLLATD